MLKQHRLSRYYSAFLSSSLHFGHMDDAIRYRLLKLLDEQPHLTQRELAMAMGVSLGKINYCLRALIDVGVVKANNFRNSSNKSAYLYALTPHGIEEKARVTHRFLLSKLAEYEAIRKEIEELQNEMKEEKRFAS